MSQAIYNYVTRSENLYYYYDDSAVYYYVPTSFIEDNVNKDVSTGNSAYDSLYVSKNTSTVSKSSKPSYSTKDYGPQFTLFLSSEILPQSRVTSRPEKGHSQYQPKATMQVPLGLCAHLGKSYL